MRSTLQAVLLVLILGSMVIGCDLTGKIKGTITDSSGNTVTGANVVTSPGEYSAIADSEGKYEIENVEIRDYTVTASSDSLIGSAITIVGRGTFGCSGETATCDVVISTSNWTVLQSPLSGTYAGVGYILTEENSPYDVVDNVYFYHTNVVIKDNVEIKFILGGRTITEFTFDEYTGVALGSNLKFFQGVTCTLGFEIFIGNGSVLTFNNITCDRDMTIKGGADISDSNIESVDIEGSLARTNTIENCNFNSGIGFSGVGNLDVSNCTMHGLVFTSNGNININHCDTYAIRLNGDGSANITYCNILKTPYVTVVEVDSNFTVTANNNNFQLTGGFGFRNNTSNNIDAKNNWWTTTSTTTITGMIHDYYDDNAHGIVSFEPIKTSTITTAGVQ